MSESLFWIVVALVSYIYFGYPFLLLILSKLRPALPVQKADITPTLSFIIPAYNEEKVIARKIENTLALNYPREKFEIIIVSDGSTDGTNEIVRTFANQDVTLVALYPNQGKSSAENQAVAEARGEILLFSDADIMLQPGAVSKIGRNFANESVGCVVGKITYLNENDASASEAESNYWRYELFLRNMENKVGNFAMGSGIMAIRHDHFHSLNPDVGEDFVLPMQTAMAGYRVVYEPEAVSETIVGIVKKRDMFQRKLRVITKDLCGLFLCRAILNPFRYPLYAWGLISHKLLRWLVPYFLIALFISNSLLLGRTFYNLTLLFQIAFYALALSGYLWEKEGKLPLALSIPLFFCLVNLSALFGVGGFLLGRKAGRWQPVRL
jgi:glycosyltransferase involved in cell wall biosynthesis